MKNTFSNNTFKLAFSSTIAALSLVLMLLTGFFPVGTFALPCFAGIFISAVMIEYGFKWSVCVYAVVSLLSLLISGDKEAVVYFIMLFGYYPLLKGIIEGKIKSRAAQYALKFAIFNAAVISAFFICSFVIGVSPEEYTIGGFYVPWAFLIAGNIFFIVYDKAVTTLVTYYIRRLRGKLFKNR